MCNGHSNRVSEGGTIAHLRPPTTNPNGCAVYDLFFSNEDSCPVHSSQAAPARTRATFRCVQQRHFQKLRECWIVIHHDGDLTQSTPKSVDPLFRFAIELPQRKGDARYEEEPGYTQMELPHALELGFGGKGVIGRRVEIVEGDGPVGWKGKTLAEGIIGWN